jgi:CBS domain-containing protein
VSDEIAAIADFLARYPPFDALPRDEIARLSRQVEIRYARRDDTILTSGQHNDRLFLVRSGSVELRLAGDALMARLGEGACFAYPSLLRGGEVHNSVTALEDTLVYAIPASEFHRLREGSAALRAFFAEDEGARIQHALADRTARAGSELDTVSLGEVVRMRQPVTCSPSLPIGDAVARMARDDVSTLAVCSGKALEGIFTDKDLRNRVVARGVPLDRPIAEVMTRDPKTLGVGSSLTEAMAMMASGGFRHIPLLGEDGSLLAILSATDILAYMGNNAIDTGMAISRAATGEELAEAAAKIEEGFAAMVASGFSAAHAMRFTSALGEAAHRRAAELAEAQLGPPPVPYALVVFGSLARGEQLLGSDQDNGLVIDDAVDAAGRDYFARLGALISDHLDAAGFVYCKGGIMAKNAEQRLTLGEWRRRYRQWIESPSEDGILRATIFFDMRSVHGSQELVRSLREEVVQRAAASPLFISFLARDALRARVPLGIFRNLVLERSEDGQRVFDAKAQAIVPIIDIARTLALAAGLAEVGTVERLAALVKAGRMAGGDAQSLEDAFLLVGSLRIEHQAAQVRAGDPPDNAIAPAMFSPLERAYLKDAFAVVREALDSLRRNHAGGIA